MCLQSEIHSLQKQSGPKLNFYLQLQQQGLPPSRQQRGGQVHPVQNQLQQEHSRPSFGLARLYQQTLKLSPVQLLPQCKVVTGCT